MGNINKGRSSVSISETINAINDITHRNKNTVLNYEKKTEMIELSIYENLDMGEVAVKCEVSRQRIDQVFQELGYKPKTRNIKSKEKEKLLVTLIKDGKSRKKILEELETTQARLSVFAASRNIKLPKRDFKWTEETMRDFLFIYENKSPKEAIDKYGLKTNFPATTAHMFRKKLGITPVINQWTDEKKKEFMELYNKRMRQEICKRFSLKYNSLRYRYKVLQKEGYT